MRDLCLSFINRILSSYTHEVRNYLAIIKETNGLMKDVIQIGKSRAIEAKQFLGFIECADEQIARATAITDYLHRFSHRMDCGRSAVNVNELIEELLALMTRLAYRKRVAFEKNLRGGLPSTSINPILFHYLLFSIIDNKLLSLDRNGIIRISTSFSEGRLFIVVSSKGAIGQPKDAEECREGEIKELAAELKAEISEKDNEIVINLLVASLT